MKNPSDCKIGRSLCAWLGKLTRYNVKADCTVTMELYADESAEAPECSHTLKGSSRQNLMKLLALLGILLVGCALIRRLCALISHS